MKPRWTAWWKPQAARIDAISLRERILMFVTVVACFGAMANWAWLTPAQETHAQLLLQLDKQTTDLQKTRVEVAAVARPVATDETVRNELAEVKARLVTVRQTLTELTSSSMKQTTPLTGLLGQLLHQYDGLVLLHTATISASAMSPASDAPTTALPEGLVRQGVELTVTGSYAELTRYIQTLEQALPQVRWGTMWLRSEKRPPELTLQLYLVEAKAP
jgi:MSHA biogenesis protein MshJ